MKFITEKDVEENLKMKELMDILEDAFYEYGEGRAGVSARNRLFTGSAFLNTMPAYIDKYGIAGLKTYIAGVNGVKFLVLFTLMEDPENFFVMEANRLGQMRTGALPGMVTRKIFKGRKFHPEFLLVGSGFQAETQLEAMKVALDLKEATVYSRHQESAEKFAKKMSEKLFMDIHVQMDKTNFRKYNVINTVTNAKEPIITEKNGPEYYHMNLVGANLPNRREVSSDVMKQSDLIIVEHMEQAMLESAEIQDVNGSERLMELKDFMLEGPTSAKRSVFKTMGIGLEDIVAGYLVVKNMGLV
ncbi:MAG: Rossmann-fold NAD(P)-binding domain-containing protein [Cuniculiplasma sp.]